MCRLTLLSLLLPQPLEMDGAAGVPAELQGGRAQADRVLTAQEWLHKWETGTAAFHKEHGHPYGTAAPRPGQRGEGPGQQNPLKLQGLSRETRGNRRCLDVKITL